MANEIQVAKQVSALMKKESIQERLKAMLDKNAESFMTSVINTINGSTQLQSCDSMSIVKSAMVAAALNLAVDPNLGFAAIVPYKDKNKGMQAQFQIMWRGLVQLAIRSGQYKTINVSEVYADEIESYNPFTGELSFTDQSKWEMRYKNDGEVVGYMAYFKLLTGFEKYLYMTKAETEKHAITYSQSYRSDKQKGWTASRWSQDFDSMGKKTVLKLLLSKFGVLSIEMQKAVTFDQAKIDGTIENPEPAYIDNPDYEEPKGDTVNPFGKNDAVDIPFSEEPTDLSDDDIPDFMKEGN